MVSITSITSEDGLLRKEPLSVFLVADVQPFIRPQQPIQAFDILKLFGRMGYTFSSHDADEPTIVEAK